VTTADEVPSLVADASDDELVALAAAWKAGDEVARSGARASARRAASEAGLEARVVELQGALQTWAQRRNSDARSGTGLFGSFRENWRSRARMKAFPAATDAAVALLLRDQLGPAEFDVLTEAWRAVMEPATLEHGDAGDGADAGAGEARA
jgi:hypothetical protein